MSGRVLSYADLNKFTLFNCEYINHFFQTEASDGGSIYEKPSVRHYIITFMRYILFKVNFERHTPQLSSFILQTVNSI